MMEGEGGEKTDMKMLYFSLEVEKEKNPLAKEWRWPLDAEKAKETFPRTSQPADTFILAQWNLFWISDL